MNITLDQKGGVQFGIRATPENLLKVAGVFAAAALFLAVVTKQ